MWYPKEMDKQSFEDSTVGGFKGSTVGGFERVWDPKELPTAAKKKEKMNCRADENAISVAICHRQGGASSGGRIVRMAHRPTREDNSRTLSASPSAARDFFITLKPRVELYTSL